MNVWTSHMPPTLYFGVGSIQKLHHVLDKEAVRSLIIMTDSGVVQAGLLDEILPYIKMSAVEYHILDNIPAEPNYQQAQMAVNAVLERGADFIIALGGGSVMDTAKLCSIVDAKTSVFDLLQAPEKAKKQMKTLMIPTTCGTGSEATCNGIVAVPEQGVKVGIVNDAMMSDYCILDPAMLSTLPPHILASTGVDALAHAVECYTSNKANDVSNVYALSAAKLILQNIVKAYENPDDLEAKGKMLLGSFYGGLSIASSGTTAVHALAYPLGGKFHVPHGVSNAILLAPVMQFNMDACLAQLSEIYDALAPACAATTVESRAAYIISLIAEIIEKTNIPTELSAYGVTGKDLDFLVDAASKVTRLLDNNCKTLSKEDIRSIYQKIL